MTAMQAYRFAREKLGSEEGQWMFSHVVKMDLRALLISPDKALSQEEETTLKELLARRLSGEPLQYLLGTQSFMGLSIVCDERALIPRLDTECVCEEALSLAKEKGLYTALDLCCGTGAIGLALHILGKLSVTFADISKEALSLAQENAQRFKARGKFVQSDLFCALPEEEFDLIVCNPPYIPTGEIALLARQVKDFEPHLALDGGEDGLSFYRRLAKESGRHLKDGGVLVCEIGLGQQEDVCALFASEGFFTKTKKDWQGIVRLVTAQKIFREPK